MEVASSVVVAGEPVSVVEPDPAVGDAVVSVGVGPSDVMVSVISPDVDVLTTADVSDATAVEVSDSTVAVSDVSLVVGSGSENVVISLVIAVPGSVAELGPAVGDVEISVGVGPSDVVVSVTSPEVDGITTVDVSDATAVEVPDSTVFVLDVSLVVSGSENVVVGSDMEEIVVSGAIVDSEMVVSTTVVAVVPKLVGNDVLTPVVEAADGKNPIAAEVANFEWGVI